MENQDFTFFLVGLKNYFIQYKKLNINELNNILCEIFILKVTENKKWHSLRGNPKRM